MGICKKTKTLWLLLTLIGLGYHDLAWSDIHITSITKTVSDARGEIVIITDGAFIIDSIQSVNAWQHILSIHSVNEAKWRKVRESIDKLKTGFPIQRIDFSLGESNQRLSIKVYTYIAMEAVADTKGKKVSINLKSLPQVEQSEQSFQRVLRMAEDALKHQHYKDAIRLYSSVISTQNMAQRKIATEMLGIAREKNGQLAHAKLLYQQYLSQFPGDDDAIRVRQRLAELLESQFIQKSPQQTLTPTSRRRSAKATEMFGSFSQILTFSNNTLTYDPGVEQSIAMSSLDFYTRRKSASSVSRLNINIDHVYDMAEQYNEGVNIRTLAFEYRAPVNGTEFKLGRRNSFHGGVLGRYDGVLYQTRLSKQWSVEATAGFPVDYGFEDSIQVNKRFASANVAYKFNRAKIRPYAIIQTLDGIIDRMAIGEEIDFIEGGTFLRQSFDYDVKFGQWNLLSLQGNHRFNPVVTGFFFVDLRRSPLLEMSNALINEFRADSISELQDIISEELIEEQARQRTGQSFYASSGGSLDITSNWYVRLDLSWIWQEYALVLEDTVSTEQDSQYEVSVQSGLSNLWQGRHDMILLDTRFTQAALYQNYQSSLRYRFRVNPSLIVDQQLRVNLRDSDTMNAYTLRPALKLRYQWKKTVWNQLELGYEVWRYQYSQQEDFQRLYFNLVYRYLF